MNVETYVDDFGDDLTTQAIRATVVAQALGKAVVLRRSQVEVVVYPKSYYVDVCRLFQASFEYRVWRIKHSSGS